MEVKYLRVSKRHSFVTPGLCLVHFVPVRFLPSNLLNCLKHLIARLRPLADRKHCPLSTAKADANQRPWDEAPDVTFLSRRFIRKANIKTWSFETPSRHWLFFEMASGFIQEKNKGKSFFDKITFRVPQFAFQTKENNTLLHLFDQSFCPNQEKQLTNKRDTSKNVWHDKHSTSRGKLEHSRSLLSQAKGRIPIPPKSAHCQLVQCALSH